MAAATNLDKLKKATEFATAQDAIDGCLGDGIKYTGLQISFAGARGPTCYRTLTLLNDEMRNLTIDFLTDLRALTEDGVRKSVSGILDKDTF